MLLFLGPSLPHRSTLKPPRCPGQKQKAGERARAERVRRKRRTRYPSPPCQRALPRSPLPYPLCLAFQAWQQARVRSCQQVRHQAGGQQIPPMLWTPEESCQQLFSPPLLTALALALTGQQGVGWAHRVLTLRCSFCPPVRLRWTGSSRSPIARPHLGVTWSPRPPPLRPPACPLPAQQLTSGPSSPPRSTPSRPRRPILMQRQGLGSPPLTSCFAVTSGRRKAGVQGMRSWAGVRASSTSRQRHRRRTRSW